MVSGDKQGQPSRTDAWCLTLSMIALVAAGALVQDSPGPMEAIDRPGSTSLDPGDSADEWLRGHLTVAQARHVLDLASRIGKLPGGRKDATDALMAEVKALSIREAAGLGAILQQRGEVDPLPWLKFPHERERAAGDRLAEMMRRFGPEETGYPSLEKTVHGPPALRKLCGDEMLTEVTGVGIWSFYDGAIPAPTSFGDDDVEMILGLRGLEWFSAEWSELTDGGVARLAEMPRLLEIRIAGTKVTDKSLHALGRKPDLRAVDVSGSDRITDAGVAALADCRQLEVLILRETRVTSASLPTIARFSRLRELSLNATRVNAGLSQLGALKSLQRIELAALGTRQRPLPPRSLEFLSGLKSLKLVNVERTATEQIVLRDLPELTSLQLGHPLLRDLTLTGLPQVGTLQITANYGEEPLLLERLELEGLESANYLIVQGMNHNAAEGLGRGLATMPLVGALYLGGEMSDGLAEAIGTLAQLKTLGAYNAAITERQLTSIAHAPELNFLHIGGRSLDSESLAGLRHARHLSRLQIDDAELDNLDFLRQAPTVQTLRLDRCRVGQIQLGPTESLTSLDVRQGEIGTMAIDECPQFSRLSLLYAHIGRLIVKSCPQFANLFCGHDSVVKDFRLDNLPALASLTIQEGARPGTLQISDLTALKHVSYWAADVKASHVAALKGLPALTHLDVSGTRLGNDAATVVSRLTTLESLGASGAFGIDGLRDISKLPALRRLHLYHHNKSDWTPQQAKRLFSHVRDVTVF